ncbi:uncharacterized protein LOC117175960 [Belonocnema kinseyi]|uniref:uncharacterized protein LOC117175960 n=1 Tax=Belonocnema kinseyi TaxID=2817044 RepID=UPI00143DA379|nr:uncharacterized protein LOC117175960 [Belonocnema kinseyi]
MKILTAICAFSSFLYLAICQPSTEHSWKHLWPYVGQPSVPHWWERLVKEWGYTEVAFFRDNQVFFIDTYQQKLCSFHTGNRNTYCVHIAQGLVSFAVPVRGHPDKFVVGCGKDIIMIKWDSFKHAKSTTHYLLKSPHQPPQDPLPLGNRVSYGGVDYANRLWFATTNDNPKYHTLNLGSVYILNRNKDLEEKIPELRSVTGGFVWDVPRVPHFEINTRYSPPFKFYYADTLNHHIVEYEFWMEYEILKKTEVVHNLQKFEVPGDPGRMAIDSRGLLWVPLLGGHRVVEYDPFQKRVLRTVRIPAAKVGACNFGGPNWDILYVSTLGYENNEVRPPGDEGGHLYAVHNLQVSGMPTREFLLNKDVMFKASAALEDHKLRKGGPQIQGSHGKEVPPGAETGRPYGLQPSLSSISQPRLPPWRETIVREWGHTEVAFFRDNQVFFIDTYEQKLCSFNTTDRNTYCAHIGRGLLSFAAPFSGDPDKFVVGCDKSILMIKWDSSKDAESTPHFFIQSPHQPPKNPLPSGNRVSYGSVDHRGRLWFATTNDNPDYHALNLGSVYNLDKDAVLKKKIPKLPSVTGGFAWDRFRLQPHTIERARPCKFFYANTTGREIIDYDFRLQTGNPKKVGVALNLAEHNVPGDPGRIAIDSKGLLWVPLLGGHRVIQYDHFQKKVLQTIRIPAAKVGACTFGGPGLSLLYVSTIGYGNNEVRPEGDEGGHIYAIHNLGVTGVQTREYVLNKNLIRRASMALESNRVKINSGEGTSRDIDLNRSIFN